VVTDLHPGGPHNTDRPWTAPHPPAVSASGGCRSDCSACWRSPLASSSQTSPSTTRRHHGVPIGLIGQLSAAGRLVRRHPLSGFAVHRFASLADARDAILHRRIYGAYSPAPPPPLLIAAAASPTVAAVLEQTFKAVARPRRLPIHDLMPLPTSDARGATVFSIVPGLTFTGIMGSAVIFILTRDAPPATSDPSGRDAHPGRRGR
jgi:hypothetical protein